MEIVNHPIVVWYCEVGLMWGMNFRVRSFFLPTHDYTHPCDGQTLSGYDFSAVGYDFFLPTHMASVYLNFLGLYCIFICSMIVLVPFDN